MKADFVQKFNPKPADRGKGKAWDALEHGLRSHSGNSGANSFGKYNSMRVQFARDA